MATSTRSNGTSKGTVVKAPAVPTSDVGVTGLRHTGGVIQEEWLRELDSYQGIRTYSEMLLDSIVGGVMVAVTAEIRKVRWDTEPADETPEAEEAAEFVEQSRDDMSTSWPDFVTEAFSMLPYGWSYHDTVYKVRRGEVPGRPGESSKFEDGRWGWRKLPIRAQDTLERWEFDADGGIAGMWQRDPNVGGDLYLLPIDRSLLFRPTAHKNNPQGQALTLDTPIPTPDGWKTMDDLTVGSRVFDEQGDVRHVTALVDWVDRPIYRVTFNDGNHIDADENHLWEVETASSRRRVLTTAEVRERMVCAPSNRPIRIPWTKPLRHPAQHLLIDPYVLGLWLGDGTTLAANISAHMDDAEEEVALIEQAGYPSKVDHNGHQSGKGRLIRVYGGLSSQLRALGLFGNKHIPEQYLNGSVEQRQALLAGLLDSDGHIDRFGMIQFVNTNIDLVDGVFELAASLGLGPKKKFLRSGKPREETFSEGPREIIQRQDSWHVIWSSGAAPPAFRLARKVERSKLNRARRHHYITSIEPVGTALTRCIEVDSPSHLFLAGRSMVPTHNSVLRSAYISWYRRKRMQEAEAIGIERDMVGIPVFDVPAEWMSAAATAEQTAAVDNFKKIGEQMRQDEQACLVMPLAFDGQGNKMFDVRLLASPGTKTMDVTATIQRLNMEIAVTVLADVILIGHDSTGSFALSKEKYDAFTRGLAAWVDAFASIMNRHAIPRLCAVNNIPLALAPTLCPQPIERVDLDALGKYLGALAAAGYPLFPSEELEAHLARVAGMPYTPPEQRPEQETRMELIPPQLRQQEPPVGDPAAGDMGETDQPEPEAA